MPDFIYRGPDPDNAIARLTRASILAVDTETVSLNDYSCIGIGVYWGDSEGAYFPVLPDMSEHIPLVMWKLSDPSVTKIYHNGNGFDLEVLEQLAREEGFSSPDDRIEDTSIMAQVHGLPAALQRIGEDWLGATDLFSISDLFKDYSCKDMLEVPQSHTADKCLNDCRTTWQLWHYLRARISVQQRECYEVDRDLIPILRTMQAKGIRLRDELLLNHQERLQRQVLQAKRECEIEGFNPASGLQGGYVLAARGNILPFTRSKRQLRTDEEALEELDDPLAQVILDYRGSAKLLSTYVKPWIGKDRAYTHYRLDLATGRLASGRLNSWDTINRNFQNIPPSMREVFRPDSGIWSWFDYSQIELRVLAQIADDKVLKDAYTHNKDVHRITADNTGIPDRDRAKTFNFAMVYGASDRIISRRTKIPLDRVKPARAEWLNLYSGIARYMRKQQDNHGDTVDSLFGRRMRLPEPREDATINPRAFESHVQKCAINYPIQGTAADIIKRAMIYIDRNYDWDQRIQVHDELVFDGDIDLPVLEKTKEPGSELNKLHPLANMHPDLCTPFETKKGLVWKK